LDLVIALFVRVRYRRDFRLAAYDENGEVRLHPVAWRQDINVIDFVSIGTDVTENISATCLELSINTRDFWLDMNTLMFSRYAEFAEKKRDLNLVRQIIHNDKQSAKSAI
jgi:hypothetical protein